MTSFYSGRPTRSFWRNGLVCEGGTRLDELYRPKFAIDRTTRIATAGSCFAQHVGRALGENGFTVLDVEPPPMPLSIEGGRKFGFFTYSARYGNIYTVRQLLQLVQEARGRFQPQEAIWSKNGRFYDALRPGVEPDGLRSAELVKLHRGGHLRQVAQLMREADVLVFTLGLTEAWEHRESGTIYPTAPGVIAGDHDPDTFVFRNHGFPEIYRDFTRLRQILTRMNPSLKFMLTVSPVPLAATATDDHVLVATTHSKAILRAVAGAAAAEFDNVDYVPSYEIITGPQARGAFYADDLRTVTAAGVNTVMSVFLAAHGVDTAAARVVEPAPVPLARGRDEENEADAVICEEALLEAFAR